MRFPVRNGMKSDFTRPARKASEHTLLHSLSCAPMARRCFALQIFPELRRKSSNRWPSVRQELGRFVPTTHADESSQSVHSRAISSLAHPRPTLERNVIRLLGA